MVPKQLQQPATDDANYLLHPLQGTVLLSALLMLCHASHKLTWDILNVGLISVCTGLQAWQLIAVPVFNSLLVTIDGGPMHKLTRAASILRAPPNKTTVSSSALFPLQSKVAGQEGYQQGPPESMTIQHL